VSEVVAFNYAPWPADLCIPEGTSWEDSVKLREEFYAKGRLESADWNTVTAKLQDSGKYEISHAFISIRVAGSQTLNFQVLHEDRTDWFELRVTAASTRFLIAPDRELSLEQFLVLGEAYWRAFSERRSKLASEASACRD